MDQNEETPPNFQALDNNVHELMKGFETGFHQHTEIGEDHMNIHSHIGTSNLDKMKREKIQGQKKVKGSKD